MKKDKKNRSVKNTESVVSPPQAAPTTITDRISVSPEDALKVRSAEQAVLQAKIQLADLELYVTEMNARKTAALTLIGTKNKEMIDIVREIAIANGIDPDGTKDSTKWNLDTNEMIFHKVK